MAADNATDDNYEPSTQAWVRDQVAEYEASGGTRAGTLRDTGIPVVIVTMRGNKTGKVRKSSPSGRGGRQPGAHGLDAARGSTPGSRRAGGAQCAAGDRRARRAADERCGRALGVGRIPARRQRLGRQFAPLPGDRALASRDRSARLRTRLPAMLVGSAIVTRQAVSITCAVGFC